MIRDVVALRVLSGMFRVRGALGLWTLDTTGTIKEVVREGKTPVPDLIGVKWGLISANKFL